MYLVLCTAGTATTNATGTRYIMHMDPAGWVLPMCMSLVSGEKGRKEQGPSKGTFLSSCCIVAVQKCRLSVARSMDFVFREKQETLIFKCKISKFQNIDI